MMIITNYSGILLFLVIAIILAVIVFAIPYLLSYKTIDREKFSSYECGFNPFKDSRNESRSVTWN
jgi:NADH-quinone oxidoreductase subunit A